MRLISNVKRVLPYACLARLSVESHIFLFFRLIEGFSRNIGFGCLCGFFHHLQRSFVFAVHTGRLLFITYG